VALTQILRNLAVFAAILFLHTTQLLFFAIEETWKSFPYEKNSTF
jgi:hypothetical protein